MLQLERFVTRSGGPFSLPLYTFLFFLWWGGDGTKKKKKTLDRDRNLKERERIKEEKKNLRISGVVVIEGGK